MPIVSGLARAGPGGRGVRPVLERDQRREVDAAQPLAIVAAGPLGLFFYGVLNRVLIVTGLHHILNNVAWFIIGDYHGATGDLHRFFAGDPSAGTFMAGFFPVMMFGLPAACLAMFHTAKPERRSETGGLLLSLALTAMLTGVTEPIEFSFMFLAPVLYLLHAILTGISMVIMDALKVRLGFGFSAGLFDYLLNFNKATRPWLLIPVGLVYFGLYYGLFRFFIVRFNLKTPGREDEPVAVAALPVGAGGPGGEDSSPPWAGRATWSRLTPCTTRLRLVVADPNAAVVEPALKALGSRGMIRPSPKDLQVVVGPIADAVAREIREGPGVRRAGLPPSTPPAAAAAPAAFASDWALGASLLHALGGADNVREATRRPPARIRFTVADGARVDEAALLSLGVRGLARPTPGSVHVLLGPDAERVAEGLRALLPLRA